MDSIVEMDADVLSIESPVRDGVLADSPPGLPNVIGPGSTTSIRARALIEEWRS
jgi:hypothetical protein